MAANRQPLLPKQMTGPICCPYQYLEEHIPEIEFDIKKDGQCATRFEDVQDRRLSRVTNTAPFLYQGIPSTAQRNRSNPPPLDDEENEENEEDEKTKGGDSFHAICIVNSLDVQDRGKKVKLLINDNSQYCVGFQRAQLVNGVEEWSPWYRVQGNFGWPSFLPCEKLPINGDHNIDVELGGHMVLDDILRSLWSYPDNKDDLVALERGFLRGVVLLCETIRLLSLSDDAVNLIRMDAPATPVRRRSYKRIRSWTSACKFVLCTASEDHGFVKASRLRQFQQEHGYDSFDDIVNELRVLKWQNKLLNHYSGQNTRWLKRKRPGSEVGNPGFDPPGQME